MSMPMASFQRLATSRSRRIERRPQFRDQPGKRIRKVFVFAAPEPVASHHHPAAEMLVVRIERRQRAAFIRREQSLQDGAALRVEIACRLRPVDRVDTRGDVGWRMNNAFGDGHERCSQMCGRATRFPANSRQNLGRLTSTRSSTPVESPSHAEGQSAQHRQLNHIIGMPDAALEHGVFELEFKPAGWADAALGRKGAAEHRAAIG